MKTYNLTCAAIKDLNQTASAESKQIPIQNAPSENSGPEVIKLFMLNSTENECFHSNKSQITKSAKFFLANRN